MAKRTLSKTLDTQTEIRGGRRQDLREKMLAVAAAKFADKGYESVSMRSIASLCGTTPAAFYYHFSSKAELYREALAYVFEQRVTPFFQIVESDRPPTERLCALFRWYAHLIADDREFARLLHREMLDGDEARIAYIARRAFKQPFRRAVELVATIKPGIDAERMALSAFCIVLGHFEFESVQQHIFGGKYVAATPDEVGMHAARTILAV